jgi:hypothetical protein
MASAISMQARRSGCLTTTYPSPISVLIQLRRGAAELAKTALVFLSNHAESHLRQRSASTIWNALGESQCAANKTNGMD